MELLEEDVIDFMKMLDIRITSSSSNFTYEEAELLASVQPNIEAVKRDILARLSYELVRRINYLFGARNLVSFVTLNKEQLMVLGSAIASKSDFFSIVGIAGSGKSKVLKLLYAYYYTIIEDDVMIMAPTGVAAMNIGGVTVDNYFGGYKSARLTNKLYSVLQEKHQSSYANAKGSNCYNYTASMLLEDCNYCYVNVEDVQVLRTLPDVTIVDESGMLDMVSIVKLMSSVPPGGKIYFFGDPYQLEPFYDRYYTAIKRYNFQDFVNVYKWDNEE
jgi:predicted ribonuclease YlaK